MRRVKYFSVCIITIILFIPLCAIGCFLACVDILTGIQVYARFCGLLEDIKLKVLR